MKLIMNYNILILIQGKINRIIILNNMYYHKYIRKIISLFSHYNSKKYINNIIKNDNIKYMEYFSDIYDNNRILMLLVVIDCCRYDNLNIYKYLSQKNKNLCNENIHTIKNDTFEHNILQWDVYKYNSYKIFGYLYQCKLVTNCSEALFWASNCNCVEIVKYLHQNSCVTNYDDVICQACVKGCLEIIEYLYQNGIMIPRLAIIFASSYGQMMVVKYLHQNGVNIDGSDGELALERACRGGHIEVVKYLHENGVNILEKSIKIARKKGHNEIVKYFEKWR